MQVFNIQKVFNFLRSEEGAMTVEYIVLLAGMTGLAVAATASVRSTTSDVNDTIGPAASAANVVTAF